MKEELDEAYAIKLLITLFTFVISTIEHVSAFISQSNYLKWTLKVVLQMTTLSQYVNYNCKMGLKKESNSVTNEHDTFITQ